jgi:hypothetical protein
MHRSGVSWWSEPSRCERNSAPAAVAREVIEAEDLEAAAVGEDRVLPPHEVVWPSEGRHQVRPRPEHQMIGVGQDHLGAQTLHFLGRQRLYGGLRPHRHEGRGLHRPMGGLQDAGAGGAIARQDAEVCHVMSMASPKL